MNNLSIDEVTREYKNPKALLHLITGIGLGVFITGLFPMIFYQSLVLGLILIAFGVGGKYFMKNKED